MIYLWASATDTGLVRDHNEDAVFPTDIGVTRGPLIAAVADGMGGHVGGEVASRVALDAAVEADGGAAERVEAANRAVVGRVADEPDLAGMGTTLTLGIFDESGELEIGHVGDSRAYLLREGRLEQLTGDHSLVAEMIASGRLRPEEAPYHPYRSVITRALGLDDTVAVDRFRSVLQIGDRLLLCTDGLTGMVPDDEIAVLLESSPEPHDATTTLVEAANAAGGIDNVTVVVVDVADDPHS